MTLILELVGEVPAEVNLEPTERVVSALVATVPNLPDGTINATLVDRDESQELNQRYSGNDYATDVLSFSYIEDGEAIEDVIGELAVCLPIATEQAKEGGINLADEVALLVLHGILHICGYDHQTPADQDAVGRLQAELMAAAGNTYREFAWKN